MKENNLNYIKLLFKKAIEASSFDFNFDDFHLEKAKDIRFGDFSTNIAMILASKLKKNPRDIAEIIIKNLDSEFLSKKEIAGPGFINFCIEQNFYTDEFSLWIRDFEGYLNFSFNHSNKKIAAIDYSHPNIAKPMGVHHLLSTIIGDSIKKIYRRYGWKVIADNFIGDMGTQFGKLMHAIKQWGNMDEIEKDPIPVLQKLYVRFHMEADENTDLDDAGRLEYKKFEEGDAESRLLWKKIVKWSLMDMQQVYNRLGVSFDYMNGESFYEDKMQVILEKGIQSEIIQKGDNGALIIPSEDSDETPVLVRKSDGATLYSTRDLARIKYWEDTWHPDLMINVVDSAQSFYFKQLFYAQEKLGLSSAKNVHVAFGRMSFKDKKMSTRRGNILLLMDVLDEAEKRALNLLKTRDLDLSEAEMFDLARMMGIGSIKYNILHQNRLTNLIFDWDRMLTFDGNSAPYLMYSVARAQSILRKANCDIADCQNYSLILESDLERSLAIQLLIYPDAIRRAVDEFKPNYIANYLYELAQIFNSFYNQHSILKAESEDLKQSRLMLVSLSILLMRDAFSLLGLEVPEKM